MYLVPLYCFFKPFVNVIFTQNNSGSVYVFPTITITKQGGSSLPSPVTFENVTTGKQFSVATAMAVSDSLVVDCANFTVKKNGVSVIGNFTGTFMWLNSGDNSMRMLVPGFDVKIEFYPRFFQP